MLELEDAVAQILAAVPEPRCEPVALGDADGRILAERLAAPIDLPGFDNSSVDGYALVADDVAGAKPSQPAVLRLAGKLPAGKVLPEKLEAGSCVRLFTGSPLPSGADAVVMQEDTRVAPDSPNRVQVLDGVKPGENVRWRGEDVRRGTVLVEAGERLTPGQISLLAAVGTSQVRVGCPPVIGVLSTGSELQEPGAPLAPGQIYDCNRLGLAALASRAGARPRVYPLVPDTLEATRKVLTTAFEQCDAVVSSGGVSVGDFDFVKEALRELGGETAFWRVAIKPGRPFVLGRCRGKLWFGLPGNPVSALVTFMLLVRPAILRWQGARDVQLPAAWGELAEPVENPGDRRHFLRVRLDAEGRVFPSGTQASHILSSLANAQGLLDMPPRSHLPAGARVRLLLCA